MTDDLRHPQAPSSEAVPFVVGADGGGTGSRAMVMDSAGRELGRANGPPALIDPSNPGAAADAIAITVKEAVAQAGCQTPAGALWTGLAGAGRAGPREAVKIALRSLGLAGDTEVGMDVEGAHRDAFDGGPGVLLAVGTGSMVWGRDPNGRETRVGGWGGRLGEEGSGYWLAMEGLRAVARAADRRDPPTLLAPTLLGSLGLSEVQELVPWVARASKAEVSALGPLVLEVASRGDAAAKAVRSAGLSALEQHLEAIREAWPPGDARIPLAFVGGLLEEGGLLRDPVTEMVRGKAWDLRRDPVVPVRGAARLALALLTDE